MHAVSGKRSYQAALCFSGWQCLRWFEKGRQLTYERTCLPYIAEFSLKAGFARNSCIQGNCFPSYLDKIKSTSIVYAKVLFGFVVGLRNPPPVAGIQIANSAGLSIFHLLALQPFIRGLAASKVIISSFLIKSK